jgi:hypothetical protein
LDGCTAGAELEACDAAVENNPRVGMEEGVFGVVEVRAKIERVVFARAGRAGIILLEKEPGNDRCAQRVHLVRNILMMSGWEQCVRHCDEELREKQVARERRGTFDDVWLIKHAILIAIAIIVGPL